MDSAALGHAVTLWTIRAAMLLYAVAVWPGLAWRSARAAWTAGCLFYLAHAAAAFQFHHGWSHAAAYAETARQTRELFGSAAGASGAGIYFNYVFTAMWFADVVWWWASAAAYRARPRAVSASVDAFVAFMFFNGAVVFASGATRWAGVALTVGLAWAHLRGRAA